MMKLLLLLFTSSLLLILVISKLNFAIQIQIFIIISQQFNSQVFAQGYEIALERMVPLPEPNIFKYDDFRVKKINRSTYVMNGHFEQLIDIDDSVSMEVMAANFQGGQYKHILKREYPKFCVAFWDETTKILYDDLLQHSNMPPW